MALFPRVIEIIVGLHKTYNFKGPIVSLGVQDTILNYMHVEPLLNNAEMLLNSVPREKRRNTTNVSLIKAGLDNAIHASTLFELMNIYPYDDIDNCPENNPSILHNINKPIELTKYNLLLDSGCLEHISNISVGLTNCVNLLEVNGYAMHCHPVNNLVNHGYFQISPILLKDFYELNGYEIVHQFVIGQEKNSWRGMFVKPLTNPSSNNLKFLNNECQYWLFTLAQKKEEVPDIQFPIQEIYKENNLFELKNLLRITS